MQQSRWRRSTCAALALWITTAVASSAQTFSVLANFDFRDGRLFGPVVQGLDGSFYGIALSRVFKLTPSGSLTIFDAAIDFPGNILAQGKDGNFYGTTAEGGAFGGGTVFKTTPQGNLTVLYSFCALPGCVDGYQPYGLVLGTDGALYGMTDGGGANFCTPSGRGCGTIFKITPQGNLTTLYSFCSLPGCTDGVGVSAPLVQGTDGNLYGTTTGGGAYNYGTVFKISRGGSFTTLYSFCVSAGCPDGAAPGGLVQAADGNLYGTTAEGGANGYYNYGTVFRVTLSGALETIYSFCSLARCSDGWGPFGLVQATDGNFYGTTSGGGEHKHGSLFRVSPEGALTTLYSFFCSRSDCTDGLYPSALVQGTDGKLYSTTGKGGAEKHGTFFSLSVGLALFVRTLPAAGKVGSAVTILGTNLTGASEVMFNGVATGFTVVSQSEIATTVPAGASTGQIQITTPGATLLSNIAFQVLP
jgi:uncharacterized repeat protein (TIGR03803 family)